MSRVLFRFLACALCLASLPSFAQFAYDEPWRPQYHFTPAKNFMNDPNGLVFYKGEYHLFYQYNPEGSVWGHMSWGHAVSDDMLHWKHLPVAIPEVVGKYMIYSGSVVIDPNNVSGLCVPSQGDPSCLLAIFTAAAKDAQGKEHQDQHLAYSNDRGRTWAEYSGNPIADLDKPDFRDPKVFWYEPQKKWVMVAVLADERQLEVFDSKDLKHWKLESTFGPAGDAEGQWECPDLFELPIEGTSESKWVLAVNRNPGAPAGGTGTRYLLGSFDGQKFVADETPTLWADYGKDFYATHRFSSMPAGDNRTVWMGWIGNWQYANKEPTVLWRGAQSLPRELHLRNIAGQLRMVQAPIAEAEKLRNEKLFDAASISVDEANQRLKKAAVHGELLEVEIEFQSASTGVMGVRLRKGPQQETLVGFSPAEKSAFIDRTHSGEAAFSKDFVGRHLAPVLDPEKRLLHIYLDRSSVEAFVNGGDAVLTERIYPSEESQGVEVFADPPQAKVVSLRIWSLRSVWQGQKAHE